MRIAILRGMLWFAVFAWATWLGGTLYQMVVVIPMWSSALPGSLQVFLATTDYYRQVQNFCGRPFMMVRGLPVLLALALAWSFPQHRRWLGLAAGCLVAAVMFTLGYVYTINDILFSQAAAGVPAEEVLRLAERWIWADRLRFAVGVVAFIALLRAFRLPLPAQ